MIISSSKYLTATKTRTPKENVNKSIPTYEKHHYIGRWNTQATCKFKHT